MRSKLAFAGLAVALGAAVTFTAAPASAVCQFYVNGHCYNACTIIGIPYGAADDALGGKLPTLYCAA